MVPTCHTEAVALPGRARWTDRRMWGRTPCRRGLAELPGQQGQCQSPRAPAPGHGVDAVLRNAIRPRNREKKPFSVSVAALKRDEKTELGTAARCSGSRLWQPLRRSLCGETGTGDTAHPKPPLQLPAVRKHVGKRGGTK